MPPESPSLIGRTAVVTGAASGIGAARIGTVPRPPGGDLANNCSLADR